MILDRLPTEGQTVIEKLESAMKEVDFDAVLATPDDDVAALPKTQESELVDRNMLCGMLCVERGGLPHGFWRVLVGVKTTLRRLRRP